MPQPGGTLNIPRSWDFVTTGTRLTATSATSIHIATPSSTDYNAQSPVTTSHGGLYGLYRTLVWHFSRRRERRFRAAHPRRPPFDDHRRMVSPAAPANLFPAAHQSAPWFAPLRAAMARKKKKRSPAASTPQPPPPPGDSASIMRLRPAGQVQLNYQESLPKSPPDKHIHPRRPLPPVPQSRPTKDSNQSDDS